MLPGIRVGHVTDLQSLTGCTVILPDRPAVGALEIAGWAAGVYGIEFLDPRHLAPTVAPVPAPTLPSSTIPACAATHAA